MLNKLLVGTGFLLLYYAIQIGNVAFVNALAGFQFMFIMVLAALLHRRIPGVSEHLTHDTSKIAGVIFVLLGFLATVFL